MGQWLKAKRNVVFLFGAGLGSHCEVHCLGSDRAGFIILLFYLNSSESLQRIRGDACFMRCTFKRQLTSGLVDVFQRCLEQANTNSGVTEHNLEPSVQGRHSNMTQKLPNRIKSYVAEIRVHCQPEHTKRFFTTGDIRAECVTDVMSNTSTDSNRQSEERYNKLVEYQSCESKNHVRVFFRSTFAPTIES
jgi:hypothetical protein